jgi:DNA-binding transcriptional regulator YiaG
MTKHKLNQNNVKNYPGLGTVLQFKISTAHELVYILKTREAKTALKVDLPTPIDRKVTSATLNIRYEGDRPYRKNEDMIALEEAKTVGDAIRTCREAVGMSAEEFGESIKASKGSVNQWEKSTYSPSLVYLARIKMEYGLDLVEIACRILEG